MTAPLYESWDPGSQRYTSVETDAETGRPVITKTQPVAYIVESAKQIAANFDPHRARNSDMVHVARIPMVIWQRLVRTGVAKDPKALNAWLDSRECRLFRCDDGRRL